MYLWISSLHMGSWLFQFRGPCLLSLTFRVCTQLQGKAFCALHTLCEAHKELAPGYMNVLAPCVIS